MNFQYLKKIENYKAIADIAFNTARKSAEEVWTGRKKQNKIDRLKSAERKRITSARRIILRRLDKTVEQFPIIDNLPEIYVGLIKNALDFDEYKKSIHALKWASGKIDSLSKEFDKQLKNLEGQEEITGVRKSFYARSFSILKKIQKHLAFLEESRKILKNLPELKEDFYTVALAGFPNVGKSSLLKAITSANPQVAEYPFTTKGLNVGLIKEEKIQFVDVPGALNRDKLNIIEKNAHLVMEYAAELVLFVLDPTYYAGYSIQQQLELFQKTKDKLDKPFYLVINKTDMVDNIDELRKQFPDAYYVSVQNAEGIEELKDLILKEKRK